MSIKVHQEISYIRNGIKNLNIATTDNTQAILDEATLSRSNENNIFSALLVEKNRAQNAEATNEQAIFSEITRANAEDVSLSQRIDNIDITNINDYIENPYIDTTDKILNDLSIVNKLYIDQKFQQLTNQLFNYLNNNDFSILGVHTKNKETFTLFNTIVTSGTQKIASLKFTPKNSNSRLNCMYNVVYDYTFNSLGTGTDQIRSYAEVFQNGVMLFRCFQQIQRFRDGGGGGTRSGCLFPLFWSVRRNVIDASEITIDIYIRNDGNDSLKMDTNNDNAIFTCTEILGE